MTDFYSDPTPIGVSQPDDGDRHPIQRITSGDSVVIRSTVTLMDGSKVNHDNSKLTFVLQDQLFSTGDCVIWTGTWGDGIELDDDTDGMVVIKIPDGVTAELRRGSFIYSLRVMDKLDDNIYTALNGALLVEYAPTSPTNSIPYKD